MTRRRHRRPRPTVAGVLVGCLGALTAALLVACAAVPTPDPPVAGPAAAAGPAAGDATAAGRTVRVLQLNLCNSGIAGCYTGRSVAEAVAVIRAEAPDVVTLNEICEDDVAVLERALAAGGPTVSGFRAAGDRRTGAAFRCRNGRSFGVGLVARTERGAAHRTTGGLYPAQDLRDPEQRAWLCVGPAAASGDGTGPPPVVACTTHLIDTNPSVAGAQCAYLLGTAVPAARARGGSAPAVVGGDLNLRSGDVRSCVPAGDRRVDDGAVQHVVASPEFAVGARRTIALRATDHPGLLVTLTLAAGRRAVPG